MQNQNTTQNAQPVRSHGTSVIFAPPTTDWTIVFPYVNEDKLFDRGFYSPSLTDGRVTLADISPVLREMEVIIKRKLGCENCLITFLVIFILTSTILLFSIFLDGGYFPSRWMPVGIYLVLVVLLSSSISLDIKRRKREAKLLCQKLVDVYNVRFATVGLRWYLPPSFPRWVELWKDYRGGQQPVNNNNVHQNYPLIIANNENYVSSNFHGQEQGQFFQYPPQNYQLSHMPNPNHQNNVYNPPQLYQPQYQYYQNV